MNDAEALKEINKALDEYLKDGGTMVLAMSRIAWVAGKNAQWHRTHAA